MVASSDGSSVTLNEATFFPTSGSATLLSGMATSKFSWAGKTGNQLTGASGHGSPPVGATCQVLPGILTSYARDCSIRAWVAGTGEMASVTPSTISAGDWSGGVSTKLVEIHFSGEDDGPQSITVEVADLSLACAGFRGECSVQTVVSTDPCADCSGTQPNPTISGFTFMCE